MGADGPTHHGVFDLSYLRTIPGMTVMAPKDEPELQNMLYSAVVYDCLSAIRYPRGRGPGNDLVNEYTLLPYGKAETICEGSDVTIVAIGSMVAPAIQTAEILAAKGLSVGIINARFVKPLDKACVINAAKSSNCIVTMEENVLMGGFGSAVLEALNDENIACPVVRIGIPDEFVEHGDTNILEDKIGLVPEKMAARILNSVNKG